MIEIMMRPSIVGKVIGALASAGLSIYNIASSSDQVLIRSANPSSSRTEVRVFESPSKHLNLTSGIAFGLFGCGLIYFALNEYNSVLEELGNDECVMPLVDHPQQYQAQQTSTIPPIPQQAQPIGDGYAAPPVVNTQAHKSHLKLVSPITADGTTMPYLIPPSEFMKDMEAEDYWNDNNSLNKE